MPKYYCDYCDTYLTHDSPSVRKTHCNGRKHKENVRVYYQKWLEDQVQKLVDDTTAAFKAGTPKSSGSSSAPSAAPPAGPAQRMPPNGPMGGMMGPGPGGHIPPMMGGMRPPIGQMRPMGHPGPLLGHMPMRPMMGGPRMLMGNK